ncbi:MAG: alpha/beta hydrolase, partial [Candidatus Dadabacteria bacterium]|nr:alpha/beta hydrolase [Candidatus Dadabacteria bacterium]
SIAKNAGLEENKIKSGQFLLTTYRKSIIKEGHLVVYIEGDGSAWKRKKIQSTNPTPKDPVALKLAAKDPRNSILYIARPCQYLTKEELKECHPKYWSTD